MLLELHFFGYRENFMGRKPRLHLPGGLYHVTLRGNNRQAIFFDDDDRQRWERLIEEGIRRYQHRIHAYCWMTNHVHLAIQCHDEPLSGFMSFVASQYARSTNNKNGCSGHLFERRHRAILVQADSYLKELLRYIHLNPMRAGLVNDLADYRWSSHQAYTGGDQPNWLTLNWALSFFGESVNEARQAYARFIQSDCQTPIQHELRNGTEGDHRVVGDDGLWASLNLELTKPPSHLTLDEITQEICRNNGVSEARLVSSSREHKYSRIRAEIGLIAIESSIATNAEIARRFNRGQSGMSQAISRLRRRIRKQ